MKRNLLFKIAGLMVSIMLVFGFVGCANNGDGGDNRIIDSRLVGTWEFGQNVLILTDTVDQRTGAARGRFTPSGGTAISFDWEVAGSSGANMTLNLNMFRAATTNIDAEVRITFAAGEQTFTLENIGGGGRGNRLDDAFQLMNGRVFTIVDEASLITYTVTPNFVYSGSTGNSIRNLTITFNRPVTLSAQDIEAEVTFFSTVPVTPASPTTNIGRFTNTEWAINFNSDVLFTARTSITVVLEAPGISSSEVTVVVEPYTKSNILAETASLWNLPVTQTDLQLPPRDIENTRNITWTIIGTIPATLSTPSDAPTLNATSQVLTIPGTGLSGQPAITVIMQGTVINGLERSENLIENRNVVRIAIP